jgi:Lon protease-like protein
MDNKTPIFPLSIVVFPYSRIPLHIFEERYKIMIGECLEKKTGFGIISILNNKLSDIGSYVKITSVLNKYSNGEMDIVIKGIERFKVIETQQHPDGYITGSIEAYKDISKEFDSDLLQKLKNNFISILNKINFKLEEAFWENYRNSKLKSYKIAEKAGLKI